MICKSCKNKNICKHYEYFKNIDIDITIQIDKLLKTIQQTVSEFDEMMRGFSGSSRLTIYRPS